VVVRVAGVRKRFNVHATPARRIAHFLSGGLVARPTPHWALDGVSIEVRRGETVGLLGMNGSGKSTLLQMVSGTMTPTEGHLAVRGRVAALLELGAGFNPDFTGRENVRLGLSLAGLEVEDTAETMSWVEDFAEIGDQIDQPVRTYSSGMFVRLAFAAAVCTNPDIVVIDEALAVGDVGFQQKCFRHLRNELAASAKLVVSHDLPSIAAICDRVIVMDNGRVTFEGSTEEGIHAHLLHMQKRHRAEPEVIADRSGRISIKGVALAVDGRTSHVVRAGDIVEVKTRLSLSSSALFGIVLRWEDRYQRTSHVIADADVHAFATEAGISSVVVSFRWPRLLPGEYLLGLDVVDLDRHGWVAASIRRAETVTAVETGEYRGVVAVLPDDARIDGPGRVMPAPVSTNIEALQRYSK
jgi:ABC-type polysaccharide/polyol phosphate transport system ATPase subunit